MVLRATVRARFTSNFLSNKALKFYKTDAVGGFLADAPREKSSEIQKIHRQCVNPARIKRRFLKQLYAEIKMAYRLVFYG
jgi:hypothetical protein